MSVILGLNFNHADSSACIIKNGKLLFAIEEERINRIKHWAGIPILSIKECLKHSKIHSNEITDIAINTNPLSNIKKKTFYFIKNYLFGEKKKEITNRIKNKFKLKDDINDLLKPESLSNNVKIHYIDHHVSHIASAYYASGYKEAIGLSIDGFGDFSSLCISKCKNGKIDVIDRVFFPDSLGLFYEAFTQFIGFKKYGEEYKVMGLSSYGIPEYENLISKEIFMSEKSFKLNLKYFNHINKNFKYNFSGSPNQNKIFNSKINRILNFKKVKNRNEKLTIKKNIACSIQRIYEKKLLEIIKKLDRLNFSKNLVYAGGCALNSLGNKQIFDSNYFSKIFIPYAPGDGGGSIGAALVVSKKIENIIKFKNLNTPFVGTDYENDEIREIIKVNKKLSKYKLKFYKNKSELHTVIAENIFKNKVIGLFNGKMEFGARALGNRSIIANPCNPNIKKIINLKIKKRENFRPFAPAILFDHKKEWFNNKSSNPYMSAVELINKNKRKLIPGVTHIDGTGRVQTVEKKFNEDFYSIIKNFYKFSKVPIILNTSFNENEPIVMSPKHAIDCFLRTKMDILVINNFIIQR